jgi:hypothetical protein
MAEEGVSCGFRKERFRLLGKYQRRGDATKKVAEMAYQPEPRR